MVTAALGNSYRGQECSSLFETPSTFQEAWCLCHPSCYCDNKEYPCPYFWKLLGSAACWAGLGGPPPFSPLVWTLPKLFSSCSQSNVCKIQTCYPSPSLSSNTSRVIDGGKIESRFLPMASLTRPLHLSNFSLCHRLHRLGISQPSLFSVWEIELYSSENCRGDGMPYQLSCLSFILIRQILLHLIDLRREGFSGPVWDRCLS